MKFPHVPLLCLTQSVVVGCLQTFFLFKVKRWKFLHTLKSVVACSHKLKFYFNLESLEFSSDFYIPRL